MTNQYYSITETDGFTCITENDSLEKALTETEDYYRDLNEGRAGYADIIVHTIDKETGDDISSEECLVSWLGDEPSDWDQHNTLCKTLQGVQ